MLQQKINSIKKELLNLQSKQEQCNHEYNESKYNPYYNKEMFFTDECEVGDVHHHPEILYRIIKKDRWTRVCSKCGFIDHTKSQRKVVVSKRFEPNWK